MIFKTLAACFSLILCGVAIGYMLIHSQVVTEREIKKALFMFARLEKDNQELKRYISLKVIDYCDDCTRRNRVGAECAGDCGSCTEKCPCKSCHECSLFSPFGGDDNER